MEVFLNDLVYEQEELKLVENVLRLLYYDGDSRLRDVALDERNA